MVSKPASSPQPSTALTKLRGERNRLATGIMVAVLVLFVLALTGVALSLIPNLRAASSYAAAGSLDQRMIRIADQLQCPVCEGQSVAFSNSQLAGEMRAVVLEKLQLGEDEAQIKQYFVDRYGIRILREPPKRGINLWLWIIPIVGFAIGMFGLLWKLRQMAVVQRHVRANDTGRDDTSPLLDSDLQKLLVKYDKDLFA